jgi:hypothetical protein
MAPAATRRRSLLPTQDREARAMRLEPDQRRPRPVGPVPAPARAAARWTEFTGDAAPGHVDAAVPHSLLDLLDRNYGSMYRVEFLF